MSRNRYISFARFIVLTAVAVLTVLPLAGCKGHHTDTVVIPTDAYMPTPTPTPAPTSSPEGGFNFNGLYLGAEGTSDADGDWVSDRLEHNRYGTDPTLIDSDGGGIDDFNEIFIYGLDPLNPGDDPALASQIPDVEGRNIAYDAGGVNTDPAATAFVINFSKRDPFIEWVAGNIQVFWTCSAQTTGSLYLSWSGSWQPFFQGAADNNSVDLVTPSWYLSHGRQGGYAIAALTNYVVLEMRGWDCQLVSGQTAGGGYLWVEGAINGKLYVIDYNDIQVVDMWYPQHGDWVATSRFEYD